MSTSFNDLFDGVPESIRFPSRLFYFLGWFQRREFKLNIFVTLSVIMLTSLFIVESVQFVKAKNVSQVVQVLEGVFATGQVFSKVLIMFHHRTNIMLLLNNCKFFWDVSRPDIKAKHQHDRKLILNVIKLLGFTFTLCSTSMVLSSFYNNTPALGAWTIKGYDSMFRFIKLQQQVYLLVYTPYTWAVDTLYFALCLESVIQFEIISCCLKEVGTFDSNLADAENECVTKLKSCITQHQYMLRFVKSFQSMFSFLLLSEYLTDVPLLLSEIFAAQESGSYDLQIRHFIVFIAVTMQLTFLCIPATYISYAAKDVANAAYFSNWETNLYSSLKSHLVLLMQSSQRGIVIRAGGIIPISTNTVVNVLKVAWSASSVMKGLK